MVMLSVLEGLDGGERWVGTLTSTVSLNPTSNRHSHPFASSWTVTDSLSYRQFSWRVSRIDSRMVRFASS